VEKGNKGHSTRYMRSEKQRPKSDEMQGFDFVLLPSLTKFGYGGIKEKQRSKQKTPARVSLLTQKKKKVEEIFRWDLENKPQRGNC
jgi:hypothetical protein